MPEGISCFHWRWLDKPSGQRQASGLSIGIATNLKSSVSKDLAPSDPIESTLLPFPLPPNHLQNDFALFVRLAWYTRVTWLTRTRTRYRVPAFALWNVILVVFAKSALPGCYVQFFDLLSPYGVSSRQPFRLKAGKWSGWTVSFHRDRSIRQSFHEYCLNIFTSNETSTIRLPIIVANYSNVPRWRKRSQFVDCDYRKRLFEDYWFSPSSYDEKENNQTRIWKYFCDWVENGSWHKHKAIDIDGMRIEFITRELFN